MEIILNGREMSDQADFHQQIKTVLNLPDYYRGNLDALWDCLTGWVEMPVTLIWNDFTFSSCTMGEYSLKLKMFFDDAHNEIQGFEVIFR